MVMNNRQGIVSFAVSAGVALAAATAAAWAPVRVAGITNDVPPTLTRWGAKVTPENALREYPRPQMEREGWSCLNGLWQYAVTSREAGRPEAWQGEILVPFAIESPLSGVGRLLQPAETLWYRRTFEAPKLGPGERLILNFECVDFRCQVWVNGKEATDVPHEGGQLPFSLDVTEFVTPGTNELVVSVWDPTTGFITSHGKQFLNPGGCLYTRSSGIVGTVWTETVPATHLTGYRVTTDPEKGTVAVRFEGVGNLAGAKGAVEVSRNGTVVARGDLVAWDRPVVVSLPRPVALWTPESPNLYGLTLTLKDALRGTKDVVRGWAGVRKVELRPDANGTPRVSLNGQFRFVMGTLDQGWWPDGLLTPPSEEAMRFDIETLKRAGFDMMRKHIKVEPRRYYALCDRLGLLVMQDLPSGFNNVQDRYVLHRMELKGMVDHLRNHPSVIAWIPYNETWGQPDREKTHATLVWTKRYDPTRLVDGASGANDWEGGELWGKKYPGGRLQTRHLPAGLEEAGDLVDMHDYSDKPRMHPVNPRRGSFLGEFGGCGYKVPGHVWRTSVKDFGYNSSADRQKLEERYLRLMDHLATLAYNGCVGSVYTQTTDVEVEYNGLLTYDRDVCKFDLAKLAAAHAKVREAAQSGAGRRTSVTVFGREDPSPTAWRYADAEPAGGWERPDFDDSGWKTSAGGIGSVGITNANARAKVASVWNTRRLCLRRTFGLAESGTLVRACADVFHDEDATFWLNGVEVASVKGYTTAYVPVDLNAEKVRAALRPGRNVLAVRVTDTCGERYFDMGLRLDFSGK